MRNLASPRLVLVVDDNRDSAESLALLLQVTGYVVEIAYDGIEAVQAAAKFLPDVVLLDIGMPNLNGYDAARQIRQQTWGRDMVLIALTGWGQEQDRERTRAAGFDAHLLKPVDHAVLLKLLASIPGRTLARWGPDPPVLRTSGRLRKISRLSEPWKMCYWACRHRSKLP